MTHGSLFSGIGEFKTKKTCKCKVCGISFIRYNPIPQYCSLKCKGDKQSIFTDFESAKRLYELGMSQDEIARKFHVSQKVIHKLFKRNEYKCRVAKKRNQFGCMNSSWVGNNGVYATFHKRVEVSRGKPNKCEVCGNNNPYIRYEWACTGNYSDVDSYIRMCVKCHRNFDKSELGVKNYVKRKK